MRTVNKKFPDQVRKRGGRKAVDQLLRLTLPEPAIIQSILAGQQPLCMSLLWFQRKPLPTDSVARREGWRSLMRERTTRPR